MLKIVIKPQMIERYKAMFPGRIKKVLHRFLSRAIQIAKAGTPIGPTGQLRSNIVTRTVPGGIEVRWLQPYASEVEFGANRIIRSATPMVFPDSRTGEWVFTHKVHHVVKPRRFTWPIRKQLRAELEKELSREIRQMGT